MYDLIIVGGGPAGLTAAVYALHKRLETLLISKDLGGKVNYHMQIKGLEGHELITGADVVERFKRQLEYLDFAHQIDRVTQVAARDSHFAVLTQSGSYYQARAVIMATGVTPQRLEVPGERRLLGRGLSYSAISHAQVFIEKEVALLGGNGRALRGAAELAEIAKRVHLFLPERGEIDSPLGEKLRTHPRVKVYENAEIGEIRGDQFVEGVLVRYEGKMQEIPLEGLFIELGLMPNSQLAADLGITDSAGRIMVNAKCVTRRPGVFAAGDVTDTVIEQVLIAVGEGAKAALSAYDYLL